MSSAGAPPGLCSALSALAGEPLAGSAADARGWVALEQPGAWGAKAFKASDLDPATGKALDSAASKHGLRPVLIRRPGRTAGAGRDGARRVLVAHSLPGRTWLLGGWVADPAAVLDLDWAAIASGDVDAVRASLPGLVVEEAPHLLVCANGKRDACCAVVGRPVAAAAAETHPDRVWETTHLGGHRFAPTAVTLPSGWTFGRLTPENAGPTLEDVAAGVVDLEGARGRSVWPGPAQVAELAVRRELDARGVDDVTAVVRADTDVRGEWVVSLHDGRRWQVSVERRATGASRPESCGKKAALVEPYVANGLVELSADPT
ncbi:sucrase ferredoxin [Nocardioides sp. HDW12B]|uniref:sucrase ferredoxin n=1 Tax=Nocardioides sp. HDW12B TaxID=2714939 RepID=UPI00140E350E|nr:sucrase ferredoxin [Nocardioides sp. HDW12B]QIK66769.1 sucrase ferredoxin [Nocardioides sp. HDW12B]